MAWKLGRSTPAPQKAPAAPAPEPVVNGFFRGRERLVSGWILDLKDSTRKHDVEVFIGGKKIGVARGDRYDEMVQSHHGGDGNYAFAIYYNGELNSGPLEVTVVDKESKTPLRSKQPLVSEAARSGPPLAIDKLRMGKTVELLGRIGAYPWQDVNLELWSNGQRVVSAIPVTGVSETEGTFSARIEGEALAHLLFGNVEIALPGLKEAGLAISLDRAPLIAILSQHEDDLRLELRGEFEQAGAIPVRLRFFRGDDDAAEDEIMMSSKVAVIRKPADFRAAEGSFEILVGGVAVPSRLEWALLKDLQFQSLGTENSRWAVSENAHADSGFFAFPASLADEHQLSGYTAHVSQESASAPLRLSQVAQDIPAAGQNAGITAFVRAAKRAKIAARLRDNKGVISETTITSKSSGGWALIRVELKDDREIAGNLVFEVEASGRNVTELEVALGNSRQSKATGGDVFGANLLANPGLHQWPNGVGVIEHAVRGEVCTGWRIFNRPTISRVLTRAVMDPLDGTLGIAVAAGQVSQYLRIEADFAAGDIVGLPLMLRFRAGAPPAARQLLADQADAIPKFAVLDRVCVVRRTRVTTADSFDERDKVAATFSRKVPITGQVERFCYEIPPIDEPDDPDSCDGENIEVSYHLSFEFRHPTVIALFDVEVTAKENAGDIAEAAPLKVEDRNIELQIEMLEAVAHWRGPTPVRIATERQQCKAAPLKWTAGASREPVTIIIPVYNALRETLACLDSLNGSTTIPILVSIIDDASDQPVREALVEYARDKPWVQVHSFARNRGYTYAADHGIREARTNWIVLLNSDTIVTRGWLEGMLDCAHSDPATAFVGPLSNAASYQSVPELYDATKKWKINRLPPGVTPEDMANIVRRVSLKGYPEVPLLNGFCTLMKRSVFIELGGLNAAAFPTGYGEENDICFRAVKAGFKLAVADDVYVYHVKSASFGTARRQELAKAGNNALAKLHPDVDIGALTARFRETPALVAVRKAVAEELSKMHGPPRDDEDKKSQPARGNPMAADRGREPQLQKA